jgi:hypothetical protein
MASLLLLMKPDQQAMELTNPTKRLVRSTQYKQLWHDLNPVNQKPHNVLVCFS